MLAVLVVDDAEGEAESGATGVKGRNAAAAAEYDTAHFRGSLRASKGLPILLVAAVVAVVAERARAGESTCCTLLWTTAAWWESA